MALLPCTWPACRRGAGRQARADGLPVAVLRRAVGRLQEAQVWRAWARRILAEGRGAAVTGACGWRRPGCPRWSGVPEARAQPDTGGWVLLLLRLACNARRGCNALGATGCCVTALNSMDGPLRGNRRNATSLRFRARQRRRAIAAAVRRRCDPSSPITAGPSAMSRIQSIPGSTRPSTVSRGVSTCGKVMYDRGSARGIYPQLPRPNVLPSHQRLHGRLVLPRRKWEQ